MKISFKEKFGKLEFTCERGRERVSGSVPEEVVGAGEAAIVRYAQKRGAVLFVAKTKKAEQRAQWWEKVRSTNVPIAIEYHGVTLNGRIVHYEGADDDRRLVSVLLESPVEYADRTYIATCFGMGMLGIKVWDDDGMVTGWTISKAKEDLIRMYSEKRLGNLATRLNSK